MTRRTLRLTAVSSVKPAEDGRTDDELMALAAAGSRESFALLVRRHWPAVRGLCAKLVGEVAAGEELAQEVWLDVWDARADYREEGRFKGFLITLSRNRCKNWLRARRRWLHRHLLHHPMEAQSSSRDLVSAVEAAALTPDAAEVLLREERQRRMLLALGKLKEAQREALVLRFHEDLEYEQIAELLGEPPSTIRSRVFYGIKALRRLLWRED